MEINSKPSLERVEIASAKYGSESLRDAGRICLITNRRKNTMIIIILPEKTFSKLEKLIKEIWKRIGSKI